VPPKAIKTVRELIYWEYAKIIAKAAGFENEFGFIMSRYTKLKNGTIKMSDILRENLKQRDCERCCVYCGSGENLHNDHLIPKSKGGPNIIDNIVLACRKCNSSKKDKDIFEWYGLDRKEEIPPTIKGLYLQLVLSFHKKAGTLDKDDVNMDGKLDVLDLGAIFTPPIPLEQLQKVLEGEIGDKKSTVSDSESSC